MQLASFFSAAAIVVLLDGARNLCRYAKFLLEALRLVRFSVTGFFASPSKTNVTLRPAVYWEWEVVSRWAYSSTRRWRDGVEGVETEMLAARDGYLRFMECMITDMST